MSKIQHYVEMSLLVGSASVITFSFIFLVALPRTMPEYSIGFWMACVFLSYLGGFVSSFLHWNLFQSTIPNPPQYAKPIFRRDLPDNSSEEVLELVYEPSYDDLFRQAVIHLWRVRSNITFFMVGVCFPLALLGTALLFLWSGKQLSVGTMVSLFSFLSVAVAVLATLLKAGYAARKLSGKEIRCIRISRQGIERTGPNGCIGVLAWPNLRAVQERKHQFVLYGKPNQVEVIDKSAIPSQDSLSVVRSTLLRRIHTG